MVAKSALHAMLDFSLTSLFFFFSFFLRKKKKREKKEKTRVKLWAMLSWFFFLLKTGEYGPSIEYGRVGCAQQSGRHLRALTPESAGPTDPYSFLVNVLIFTWPKAKSVSSTYHGRSRLARPYHLVVP